jgi:hypothetical protein
VPLLLDVDIVGDEVIYRNAADTARVEQVTFTDGTVEYNIWLKPGSTALDHLVCTTKLPFSDAEGLAYKLADHITDDGLVGMIYRTEGF